MSWELNGKIKTIQKKIDRENKSREAYANLIVTLSKNESILSSTKQKKSELLIKMSQPGNSSQWLARASIWLKEFDDKINRYDKWIKEGKEKLKNWKD